MEREYVVSFILIIVVIFIIGFVSYKYYPKVFDEVSSIAKDVFKYGDTQKKIKATQASVQSILDSISECQKTAYVSCTCNIKNKGPIAKDYRVFFKTIKNPSGASDMLVYAFSDQDQIIPIKADSSGLKLDNLRLGIAYWAHCPECGDTKDYADIYCVFSAESAAANAPKVVGDNPPIMLKGDGDKDWAFVYHTTQGVPFDQLAAKSEYSGFGEIGNILKIDGNRYCFITTNLLRPGDDGKFRPLPLKKTDDFIKLIDVPSEDQMKLISRGLVTRSMQVGWQWPPVWVEKEGRELPDMNEITAMDKLMESTTVCNRSVSPFTYWGTVRGNIFIETEDQEKMRPFDWPIKPSTKDMKVVCERKSENGKNVYWLDRIKAPAGTPVLASTDAEVYELCDEKCAPGKKYVILKDEVDSYKREADVSKLNIPADAGIVKNANGKVDIKSELSILIYFGNLQSINSNKVKIGADITHGEVLGALGDPLDAKGPWLDYRVTYADGTSDRNTLQFFNYVLGAARQQGYTFATVPNALKGRNYFFAMDTSPYAKLHEVSNRLPIESYENCDDTNTANSELSEAIALEKGTWTNFDGAEFTYEYSGWSDIIKSTQSSNPRSYRNL